MSIINYSRRLATRVDNNGTTMAVAIERVGEEGAYYLERVNIVEDSDDEFKYEDVAIDDDYASEPDEDLHAAVRTIQEAEEDDLAAGKANIIIAPPVTRRPEVVDDFIRNFLVKMGMNRTLDCFQTEWYELQQRGLLKPEDIQTVPDVYTQNQHLDDRVKLLRRDVDKFKNAANRAKESFVKLTKERDFHRMHHKRIVQEKNKLISDIKKLKKHYSSYEPTLRQLKEKYEAAMKEKMLTKLERDRAVGEVVGLQSTLRNFQNGETDLLSHELTKEQRRLMYASGIGPTQSAVKAANEIHKKSATSDSKNKDVVNQKLPRHLNDSEFPCDTRTNPALASVKGPSAHLTRSGGFRLTHTIQQAHSLAVSGLALHTRKQILATVSDDHTWKMWAIPSGDIVMTGEGHKDWIADCDFHPNGHQLATASGDVTVKIWDFSKAECIHTFTQHQHSVWGVSWHKCGDFIASCSMDSTSKIWDLNSLRCRNTLRGHADSVNSIEFLPYSNTLVTSSADKTLSLWDARTGLCGQTFYGHVHSVNHVTFNLRGDTLASCDSYGVIKLWDVRTCAPMTSIDVGPHPANKVAFDPSSSVLAIASSDSTVKMFEIASGQVSNLTGHEDAVQSVIFDRTGDFLVSGGSDSTVRIWS
ncbi:sperm-associated antigen 16 protein-like [Anneissia japonica]|uniref:sperm-associated antigen 16 protein-like n=1 Tax=Anneissia japonica TaxID=1529436 RepID=UPI0014256F22|nr:sperm-associated antigen 16 protein-like [Anneissia japonica]